MPIGLVVRDGENFENGANGHGPALGRELEIASLLSFVAQENISNLVFLTADVHYCAAHYYNPQKAVYKEFKPFWEFVTGPLHAGTFGPNQLDNTFGPEVKFVGILRDLPRIGRRPMATSFGVVEMDGGTKNLTVRQVNVMGEEIFRQTILPE